MSYDNKTYFAICLPGSLDENELVNVEQLVFSDKDQALKLAKKFKGSRFKAFKSEEEARQFTTMTAEAVFASPRRPSAEDAKENQAPAESSPYKAPRPQELAALRKVIEAGNLEKFRNEVWNNPRYLVGSGDTPAIYQEGPRYTAMHVAALKNKPEICQCILDTLEDSSFIERLYTQSRNTEQTLNSHINFLVDLYLNMPDKGNCESPLHMACKFGHDKVVEVLSAHPRTDKTLKNKYGETPKDVICSRCRTDASKSKQKIEILLQGQFYIPLMRSDDNTSAPVIGQPWSPDLSKGPFVLPQVTSSPRESVMSVRACAGPMSPKDAGLFHKTWTTPPSQSEKKKEYFHIKRSDSEKGMERIGRRVAAELHLPWSEYWEFLDQFIDISTPHGLDVLEEYFCKRIWFLFAKDFKEKHCIIEDNLDAAVFTTPVINKAKGFVEKDVDSLADDGDRKKSTSDKKTRKLEKSDHDTESDEKKKKEEKANGTVQETLGASDDVIVSPMTNLAQTFAQLQLLDDSWSEKATVDSSDEVDRSSSGSDSSSAKLLSSGDSEVVLNGNKSEDSAEKVSNERRNVDCSIDVSTDSVAAKLEHSKAITVYENGKEHENSEKTELDVQNMSRQELQTTVENDFVKDVSKLSTVGNETHEKICNSVIESSGGDNENIDVKDKNVENSNNSSGLNQCTAELKEEVSGTGGDGRTGSDINGTESATETLENGKLQRFRSTSTGSSGSFETAAEGSDVSNLSYCSQLSDSGDQTVCVRLQDCVAFDRLETYVKDRLGEDRKGCVCFILQWRPYTTETGQKVTIVTVPCIQSVSKLLVIENIGVASCDGDISKTQEGEVIEIGIGGTGSTRKENLLAYLTRSETLPKCGYIHGPQPTREDLDVSRALGDALITPDRYPNVFHWKINLCRFLKDTKYRWQSPLKLKTEQRHAAQLTSLRRTSPVISYSSPVRFEPRGSRTDNSTGIRTNLFPHISE